MWMRLNWRVRFVSIINKNFEMYFHSFNSENINFLHFKTMIPDNLTKSLSLTQIDVNDLLMTGQGFMFQNPQSRLYRFINNFNLVSSFFWKILCFLWLWTRPIRSIRSIYFSYCLGSSSVGSDDRKRHKLKRKKTSCATSHRCGLCMFSISSKDGLESLSWILMMSLSFLSYCYEGVASTP